MIRIEKRFSKKLARWVAPDRDLISTAIIPLSLIHEEQLSVNGERMYTKYWFTASRRLD